MYHCSIFENRVLSSMDIVLTTETRPCLVSHRRDAGLESRQDLFVLQTLIFRLFFFATAKIFFVVKAIFESVLVYSFNGAGN